MERHLITEFICVFISSIFICLCACRKISVDNSLYQGKKQLLEKEIATLRSDSAGLATLLRKYQNAENLLGQILIYEELGKQARKQSRFSDAIENHRRGLDIASQLKDTVEIVQALNNLGTNFRRIGALDEASDYHYKALKIAETFSGVSTAIGTKNRVIALNGIGNISLTLNQLDDADRYFRQALKIEQDLNSDLGQAINYANIGAIYALRAEYDSAFYYYSQSMKHNVLANSELGISLCHTYIGHIYEEQNRYDEALMQYMLAYKIMEKSTDQWHWLDACLSVGKIYTLKGEYHKAERYLKRGESVAVGIGSKEHLEQVNKLLSDLYRKEGKYKIALEKYALSTIYQDSIKNAQQVNRFLDMRIKYEHEKNEKYIQELHYQNELHKQGQRNILIILILSTLLFIVLIFILYYKNHLRKRKALEIKKLEEMKSNFFMNITHEFRTPLTVILGLSRHILQKEVSDEREVYYTLRSISRQGEQLLHLVNQILDIARSESGADCPEWKNGDVVTYLRMLSDGFRQYALNKQIDLIFLSTTDSIQMDFVPDYLEKIVGNLLSNAFKHCGRGDKVILYVSKDDYKAACVIEVRDSGNGIAEKDLPRIFELYYLADSDYSRDTGTGVGLALTRQLVDKLDGTIEVRSTPRKETVFTISLPVMNKIQTRLPEVKDVDLPATFTLSESTFENEDMPDRNLLAQKQETILIVEDNKDVAQYISSVVSVEYNVFFAGNGQEGLKMAEQYVPDLVITDLMMPEKDGFAFCKEMRSSIVVNHIPIIIITAKNNMEDRLLGFKCGADAFLVKPFHEEELITRIRQLLESRKHLKEKYCRMVMKADEPLKKDTNLEFLQRITDIIYRELSNPDFFPGGLAAEICLSTSQLNRKLKALSGYTCSSYVMKIRMNKARKLLFTTEKSIGDVAFECGFSDLGYFSRTFKKEFNCTPSQYQRMPQ